MGQITISIRGSFSGDARDSTRTFSAMESGHAAAVGKAIQYLSEEVLPDAIRNDHAAHAEGELPRDMFGLNSDKRPGFAG